MGILSPSNIWTSVFVTVAVALFVLVLPALDQKICARIGISPQTGSGTNPNATRLLMVRKAVLVVMLALYGVVFSYMVFFSRHASEDYQIHIDLFANLANAVDFDIDFGVLGFLQSIFTEGPVAAFSHVKVISFREVAEVYLNVMLFVPIGYLLPYVFRWFREHMRRRTVLACFLISLATENIQLVMKVGYYDMDDLITNTLGGFIGQALFMAFAFVVTNPKWRRDLESYRRWRKTAKSRTLYSFARGIELSRTTLLGTNEEAIHDFYVDKLGFRQVGQVVPLDRPDTTLLFQMGQLQVEILCSNTQETLSEQHLNISARKLEKVRARLLEDGIEVGPIEADAFGGTKRFSFRGPDNVCITILESYVS